MAGIRMLAMRIRPCSGHPAVTRWRARTQVQLTADAPHAKLAIVPDETDFAADDGPADAVVVRCDALSGGAGGSSDAHSAAGGGDWRTAMLRIGEAYPAETPCVEFQSGAPGFGSRQASAVCRHTVGCLCGHQIADVRSLMCDCTRGIISVGWWGQNHQVSIA